MMNKQRKVSNILNILIYDDLGNIVLRDYSQVVRYSWDGLVHAFIGPLNISSIAAAVTDTDRFLVSDGGVIKYRTGAEVLSDIGGQAALTNPVTGTGATGQVAYWSGTNTQAGSNNLFWDNANGRLGVGTNAPANTIDVNGSSIVRGNLNVTTGGATIVGNSSITHEQNGSFQIIGSGITSGTISIYNGGSNTKFIDVSSGGTFFIRQNGNSGITVQSLRNATLQSTSSGYSVNLIATSAGYISAILGTTEYFRIAPTSGNLLIQNGGTFTDSGQRLQVQGTSLFNGNTNITGGNLIVGNIGGSNTTISTTQMTNGIFDIRADRVQLRVNAGPVYFYNNGDSDASSTIIMAGRNGANTAFASVIIGSGLNASLSRETMRIDNQNQSVLIGTTDAQISKLVVGGSQTASSAIARGTLINTSLSAAANNDVLVGLDVAPTFSNGAFTGVTNYAARFQNNVLITSSNLLIFGYSGSGADSKQIYLNTSGLHSIGFNGSGGSRFTKITGNHGVQLKADGIGGTAYLSYGYNADDTYAKTRLNLGTTSYNSFYPSGRIPITWGATTDLSDIALGSPIAGVIAISSSDGASKLLINTTTASTFNLDVNGTARVQGEMTVKTILIGRGGGDISTNTRVGVSALNANTTGDFCSAFGGDALKQNTTGQENTAIGYNTLLTNTTGRDNTALGVNALRDNTIGSRNHGIGRATLLLNTTGNDNNALGYFALRNNTTGSNNIALGASAGRFITGGLTDNTICNTSIFIGSDTRAGADNQSNQIVIGNGTTGNGSNTITIGNSSITNNYIAGNFNVTDAANIILGTTTGTKIGTATTQKLSFWDATPIVQPGNTVAINDVLVNTGLRASGGLSNFSTSITYNSTTVPLGENFYINGAGRVRHTYNHAAGTFTSGFGAEALVSTATSPSYTSGMFYGAFSPNYVNEFEGSATVPNSVIMASGALAAQIGFLNSATVTMTQGTGVRAFSGQTVLVSVKPGAAASSTLTHAAGILVLAPYYASSGSPTFTNWYGLAINDSTEYSASINVTNRWGIYQQGASDKNYLNGTTLIGTATDPGLGKLHVAGTISTATPTGYAAKPYKLGEVLSGAASADSSVVVEIDGTVYFLLASTTAP